MTSDAASAYGTALRDAASRRRGLLIAVLAIALVAIGGVSWHRYVTLEREFTDAALARRAALAAFSAATLSERLDRVVDIGVSLASRVQFRELTATGRWEEAAEILRSVPRDFKFVTRVSLTDVEGSPVRAVFA